MPISQRRHRRLVTVTILAALTAGALAAGATVAGASPATGVRRPLRAVTVQDPLDTGDQRADLRSATVAVGHDRQFVTVSARLSQPTSPATENWWRGTSLPRPGIVWGLNTDPTGRAWDYTAQLRGDPDLGTYGFVAYRGQLHHDEPRCRVAGSFDGHLPDAVPGALHRQPRAPALHRLRAAVQRHRRRHHRRRLRPGVGRALRLAEPVLAHRPAGRPPQGS
jgi:hypothetical protein